MRQFGLLGKNLTHSFSCGYFSEKFYKEEITDAIYQNYELNDIAEFPQLINKNSFNGLNVTIPYKKSIIPFLDCLSDQAKDIGAVNTILFEDKTIGFNTDWIGFYNSIKPILKTKPKTLILGNGGAASAIIYALQNLAIDYIQASRNESLSFEDITKEIIREHLLIIQTTPIGMYPNTNEFPPIPYQAIGKHHLLYDLIYNPIETKFLQYGKARGAQTKNGTEMLYLQAEESWKIWNEKKL